MFAGEDENSVNCGSDANLLHVFIEYLVRPPNIWIGEMFSVCFSGLLRTEDESLITVLFSYEGVLVQLCVESPSSRFDVNQDGFSRKAASCVLSLVCKESDLR